MNAVPECGRWHIVQLGPRSICPVLGGISPSRQRGLWKVSNPSHARRLPMKQPSRETTENGGGHATTQALPCHSAYAKFRQSGGVKVYNEVEKRLRSSKISPVRDWY
jgi:hypothetical protein